MQSLFHLLSVVLHLTNLLQQYRTGESRLFQQAVVTDVY